MYTFPVNEIEGQNFHTFHTEIYQRVLTTFIEISNANIPKNTYTLRVCITCHESKFEVSSSS